MKSLKIMVISLIILILIAGFSYANFEVQNMMDRFNTNSNKTVYASSSEVLPNQEFYLILNLSKIDYHEFKVRIINNSNVVTSEVPTEAKNVSVASKEVSFSVNKENISIDKMGVAYTAPAEESSLEFKIEITSLDDNVSKWKNEISTIDNDLITLNETLKTLKENLEVAKKMNEQESENANSVNNTVIEETTNEIANTESNTVNNTESSNETIIDTEKIEKEMAELEKTIESHQAKKEELQNKITSYTEEKIEKTITIKVVQNAEKSEINESDFREKMEKEFEERDMSQMKKMMQSVDELEGNLKTARNQISELTKTNTYQGSQNNYLSSLSITNVNFKSEFNKTNLTYFAEVDSGVTDLTVNAVPEDSSAIVTIYGNTHLKVGQNKIMISVTADDGNVKNYKIYVEKKG